LRFGRDRRLWTSWLYEARVRRGPCVLDCVVEIQGLRQRYRFVDRVAPTEALEVDVEPAGGGAL